MMIEQLTRRWFEQEQAIRLVIESKPLQTYLELVTLVATHLDADSTEFDSRYITEIKYGMYNGNLLYIFGSDFGEDIFYCRLEYGSCSACDTFSRILDMQGEEDEKTITDAYMLLALHIVQQIKELP